MFIKLVFTAAFSVASLKLQAQQTTCKQVYRSVTTEAQYKNGSIDLAKFSIEKIAPIIAPDSANSEPIIFSLHIVLTVNNKGQVIDVCLIRFPGLLDREKKIKLALMAMSGWRPAKVNGQPVCSVFDWPIPCFLWGPSKS